MTRQHAAPTPWHSVPDEELRARLRTFLGEHHPGPAPREPDEAHEWGRAWMGVLVDHGVAAPSWPTWAGGMDLSLSQQLVYHEEMARARAPRPNQQAAIVGPTIIRHGTPEQHARFLQPMLRGTHLWCQGYSEPGAGSDLASLQTRAVRDGDEYVVNGQKVWTSGATRADWCFALVRTGRPDSRHRGITYLLIDMRTPGIDVRPLRDLTGSLGFAELFLTDVRVPVANRLGDEDDGWRLARTSLGHERSTMFISQVVRYRRVLDELVELARERGLTGDPRMRQRLAELEIHCRLEMLNGQRVLQRVLDGGEPGPGASVTRLFHAQFEQSLHEAALSVLGPAALLARHDRDAVQGGRWVHGFLKTRGSTIGTGTAEIQRNTVAERVLGLPSEPSLGR